jgi:hypothetical protein
MSNYFVGQGKVYVAVRSGDGITGGFIELGNSPEFTIQMGASAIAQATGGGQALPPANPDGESPSFTLTLEELSADNLTRFLYGSKTAVTSGSVSEAVVAYKGRTAPLSRIGLTSFISLTGGYTAGSDYVVNLDTGSISFPATSAIPDNTTLTANYLAKAQSHIGAFTTAPPYHWVRFEGVNTADNNSPVVIDIPKTRIRPAEDLPLIGDDLSRLAISGRIFYSVTGTPPNEVGEYLRIRML